MGRSSRAAWEADFAAYYVARGPALRRTAFLLCGDWHEAEDLVQVTFVKLYQRWRRVRAETADAYTRRMLVNAFVSGRRLRRGGEIPHADPPEAAAPEDTHDDRLDLTAAIGALSPRQRAIVVLRFWEDLSVAETAELLGVAEGTVKAHTGRAVHALRGLIDGSRTVTARARSGQSRKDVRSDG